MSYAADWSTVTITNTTTGASWSDPNNFNPATAGSITFSGLNPSTTYNFSISMGGYDTSGNYRPASGTTSGTTSSPPATYYNLSYDANGGSPTPSGGSYASGYPLVAASAPSRSGYTFQYWSRSDGGSLSANQSFVMPSNNLTLTAVWTTTALYSVVYSGNGNTSGTAPTDSATYGPGATITAQQNSGNLQKTGYSFGGWSISTGGTVQPGGTFSAPGGSGGSITLSAIWNLNSYTVTWNANGGTVSPASNTVGYASTVTAPLPTRSGYAFLGWYAQASGGSAILQSGTSYTVYYDTTFYAQWLPLTPKVYTGPQNGWQRAQAVLMYTGAQNGWQLVQMKVQNNSQWNPPL